MHTVAPADPTHAADAAASALPGGAAAPVARVAVAGATGYTGQELLRLLSRHPAVALTAAMSSGQTGASVAAAAGARHLWSGTIIPLRRPRSRSDAESVFLALPDSVAAELAPSLVEAGVRVIDLSGAFRLAARTRARGGIRRRTRCRTVLAYGLTEH